MTIDFVDCSSALVFPGRWLIPIRKGDAILLLRCSCSVTAEYRIDTVYAILIVVWRDQYFTCTLVEDRIRYDRMIGHVRILRIAMGL